MNHRESNLTLFLQSHDWEYLNAPPDKNDPSQWAKLIKKKYKRMYIIMDTIRIVIIIVASGFLSLIAFVNYFSNLSLLPFILFLGVSVGGIIMLMSQYNIADIPNFHSTEDQEKYERCQADTYHIGLIICFIFLFLITLYYVIVWGWNKTGKAFTNFGEAATSKVRGARDGTRASIRSGVAGVRSTASSVRDRVRSLRSP